MNSIARYLEDAATKFGPNTAIVDETSDITYRVLRDQAIKIATGLIHHGTNVNLPIAVYLPKSAKAVVAFLSVLYSGNPYVPIDYKMPTERLKKILINLEPQLIISDQAGCNKLIEMGIANVLIFDDLMCDEPDEPLVFSKLANVSALSPAYIIYTSGSTGMPKGVAVSHLNVDNFSNWAVNRFNIDSTYIFGNQVAFHFDLSIFDFFSCFLAGAQLTIIPEYLFSFSSQLLEYVKETKINLILWVPSALVKIANYIKNESIDVNIPDLKMILFCGEVMPTPHYNILKQSLTNAVFANWYGPAETTITSTYYVIDRVFLDSEPLPVGIPVKNTEVLLLTDEDNLAKIDEIGEICIKGLGVSLGYWNAPEITKEKFVINPLNKNYNELVYRTGDLGKFGTDGLLRFLGRKDYQIKLNGHRIELGEIEAAALTITGIMEACVLFKNEKVILCYSSKSVITEKDMKLSLMKQIPKYMVPTKFVWIDNFAYNSSGKIDRLKLGEMV